jgi:hypothetical protein
VRIGTLVPAPGMLAQAGAAVSSSVSTPESLQCLYPTESTYTRISPSKRYAPGTDPVEPILEFGGLRGTALEGKDPMSHQPN